MSHRKLAILLIVTLFIATGCIETMVRAKVNSDLNIHYSKPDINKLTLPADADKELTLYFNILKDYENSFRNFHGEALNVERMREVTIEIAQNSKEDDIARNMDVLGMTRHQALRKWQADLDEQLASLGKDFKPKELPPNAISGLVTSDSDMIVESTNSKFKRSTAQFMFEADSFEESTRAGQELFDKLATLGFAQADWTVVAVDPDEARMKELGFSVRNFVYKYTWESELDATNRYLQGMKKSDDLDITIACHEQSYGVSISLLLSQAID